MQPRRLTTPAAHTMALGIAVVALLSSCGGADDGAVTTSTGAASSSTTTITTVTTIDDDTVLLRYSLWGGCNVASLNCPVYTVYADGTVEVGRNTQGGPDDPGTPVQTEVVGHVPASDVADWLALADATTPDRLLTEVGPGECSSCVDGADITVIVHPGTDAEYRLESRVVKFDPAHPLFAALSVLAAELADAAPLPIIWPQQSVTT